MTTATLLDNRSHRTLRLLRRRGADLGDSVMSALVFPREFRSAAAHYPLVFQTTTTGSGIQPVALFGLSEGQNLFLTGGTWDADYLPLSIRREPFMIGRIGEEQVITFDPHSPRLSQVEGDALFGLTGEPTPTLERVNEVLAALHEGVQQTPAFVDALLRHRLIESFAFDADLQDGSSIRLTGLSAIHEERLAELRGSALEELHRDGHLLSAYLMVASLAHLRSLVRRYEDRVLQEVPA